MNFYSNLLNHANNLIFLLIWLGGLVYAFVNRQKHPWTSLLAGGALGILFVAGLLSSLVSIYVQYGFSTGNMPFERYSQIETAVEFFTVPLTIVGRLLLLAAIFWRKDASTPEALKVT